DALEGEHWGVPLFRLMNGDVVRAVAKEALAGRARADVLAEGRRLGVPITPVNTPEEFVAEEQTRVRGYFRKTAFPQLGDAPFAPRAAASWCSHSVGRPTSSSRTTAATWSASGASTTRTCSVSAPTSSTSPRRASAAAGRWARPRPTARSTGPSRASPGSGTI